MTRKKHPFRPATRAMALEPRVLFDGAAAVAVADHPSFSPERDHLPQDAGADHGATKPAAADATLARPATDAPAPSTIVIIDARVADYQSLLPGLPANALVRVVQADESGLAAISQALQGRSDIGSVQIIGHGTPGQFTLGSDRIDSSTLATQATQDAQLQSWAPHLTAHADILLYGCDIAQGPAGQAFITELAHLTGADIAASTDPTGAASRGGDWTLEAATGAIEAQTLAFQSYDHLLAATAVTDANAATPRVTAEDTSLGIIGVSVAGGEDDVITLRIVTTGGTSTLGTVTGLTFTGTNGSASFSIAGTIADVNAALATLSYLPTLDQNSSSVGGFSPSIALDVTVGGTGNLTISNISVTAVNDAPSLGSGVPLTVSEGGSNAFSRAQLASSDNALDVDIQTGQQVLAQQMVQITSLPTQGTLTYKNGPVVTGSVVPVSDLASLKYTHNGADVLAPITDTFNVKVSDGGGEATPGTISITINPVNKAPTISGDISLYEGQSKAVAPTIDLGDTADTLAKSTITISNIVTGDQGSFFIDANSNGVMEDEEAFTGGVLTAAQLGQFKFLQKGYEPNTPGALSPSYKISVQDYGGRTDGTGTSLTTETTITITVQPNNDQPVVGHITPPVTPVNERGYLQITTAMLQVTDPDLNPADPSQLWPAANLVYTVVQPPTHGQLLLQVSSDVWKSLDVGGRFTQADIDDGKVKYYQSAELTGTDIVPEKFTFTVRDSAYGYELPTPDVLGPIVPGAVREGDVATGAIKTLEFAFDLIPVDGTGGGTAPTYDNMTYGFDELGTNFNGAGSGWTEGNVGNGGVITQAMLEYKITRTIGGDAVLLPPIETVYTLTSLATNGVIQRDTGSGWQTLGINANFTQADINANKIRFVHDGGEDFIDSFNFMVSDGTEVGSEEHTFTINVAPINDRPTGSGGSVNVLEGDGNTVRLGAGVLGMTDVDGVLDDNPASNVLWNTEGVADNLWFKILTGPTTNNGSGDVQGKLQYWNGSTWTDITPGAELWLHSSLLTTAVAGETSGLRYVHNGSEPLAYAGGPKLTFTYQIRDDLAAPVNFYDAVTSAVVDSGTAQSNASTAVTATIGVIPVNNPPQVADKPSVTDPTIDATITGGGEKTGKNEILANVPEGGTATITSAHLTAIDPDNTTVQRQYRITAAPTQGVLQLNGATLGVGSTFTQTDIDAGKVTYKHNGMEVGARITDELGTYNDKFHFVVNDGVAEDSGNAFLITLTPANDIPTIAFQTPAAANDWFIINSTDTGKTLPKINLGDQDLADAIEQDGEQDFVQVTVEFQTVDGTSYTNGVLDFSSTADGVAVIGSAGGPTLVFQGKLADVQTALDKVQARVSADDVSNPSDLKIKITVDDRLRDGSGALLSTVAANGGTTNANGLDINDTNNRVSIELQKVAVSTINNPPVITVPGGSVDGSNGSASVLEDIRTLITGITFTDPDAFNSSNNSVTLSVDSGRLYFHNSDNSVTGGASVTAGAVGSNTVTLTGTKAQLDTALENVRYLNAASATDFNGTTASAKDATLTVTVNDGGNTGSDGAKQDSKTIAIQITPVNDAPTVAVGTGVKVLTPSTATFIDGIAVADKDIRGDITSNGADELDVLDSETDFVQVTVRVVQKNGANWDVLADSVYNNGTTSSITIGFDATAAGHTQPVSDGTNFQIDTTYTGTNSALVIRGELDQVNAYLAGLTLRLNGTALANADARYGLQVIVDDRVRNVGDGALNGIPANGGLNPNGSTTAAPPTDNFTPYQAIPATVTTYNVASGIRELLPSDVNDPATINGSLSAAEGTNNYVTLAGLTIADPDALDTNELKATVTLPADFKISNVGSGGGTFAGNLGDTTFTIRGTLAQINARLGSLQVGLPDVASDATAADWNGSFDVTVKVEDLGNNGGRPDSLAAGDNATTGTFTYADGPTGTDNDLVTTRTLTFTVTPTNDAPVAQLVSGNRDTSLPAIDEDPGHVAGDTADTSKTVNDLFSPYFNDGKDEIKTGQVGSATADTGTNADTFWGVAVVGNAATTAQGQWEYHNGTGWVAIATDVANNKALILDKDTPLRFTPAADYHGAPGKLSVRLIENNTNDDPSTTTSVPASDTGNHNIGTPGGTSRYSNDTVTLGITVNNVNDRPTSSSGNLTTTEDVADVANTGVTVGSLSATLTYSDAKDNQSTAGGTNSATAMGGIAIVGDTTSGGGHWEYSTDSGTNWANVPAGLSDAAALVLGTADKLRFVPDGNYNGTPTGGLSVRVADTAQTAATGQNLSLNADEAQNGASTWSATQTLGTTVTPLNDAPTLTNTATNPTVTENTSTGSGTSIDPVALLSAGAVADIDLTTTAVLSAPTFGAGTITVTLTDGVAGDVLQIASGVTAGIASTSGGTGNTPLVITLANTATVSNVEAILAAIQYKNTSDNPTNFGADTTRSYTVVLNDGNNAQSGGNAGGPALSATTINGTITIGATNDPPVATNNTNSVTEDGGVAAVASGNVRSDGVADSDPDTPFASLTLTSIRTGPETGGTPGTDNAITLGTTSTNGTQVVGKYGTLTIGADGSYSYALDNSNPTVNALIGGQTLTDEVFTYTLSDGDKTDTATLTITINGNTDGGPSIAPVDGNGAATTGEATVYEHGLTSTGDTSETTTGTINVSALDGMASVTIGGIGGTTFTVAQLNGFTTASPSAAIDTGEGFLRITGFTSSGDPTAPTAGTLNYTYTLKAPLDQPGATDSSDAIALTVTDKNGSTATGTLTVQIIDDTPLASNDSTSLLKQTGSITGSVYGNDTIGADGAAVAGPVTAITGGSVGSAVTGNYGSLTLNANGSYTYTVDATDPAVIALTAGNLTDTFNYTITDKDGDTSTATLVVTITGNRPPVATPDTRATPDTNTTPEDTPVSGNVLTNDSDADGNPLTVTGFDVGGQHYAPGQTANIPGKGTLTLGSDGSYTFTPVADWNGTVPSVSYSVSDGKGGTASSTLAITVTPVVDIADDSASTRPGTPVTTRVLGNDSFENPGHTITGVTQGAHGSVTLNPDGTITYTPNPGYVGNDRYTYTVTSGGVTETATVTVTITNTAPVATPDTRSTPEDTPVSGNVLTNDSDAEGDPLTVTGFDVGGQHYAPGQTANIPGKGTLTLGSDGSYTFTPVADWHGPVPSVSYQISNGKGGTASSTLAITVTPVPDAVDDAASTRPGTPVTTNVLGNDSFENPGHTITGVTQGAHGSVTVNPDGTITYTPTPGYVGNDSYTYTVTSGGVTETATVTVNVMAENPPLAVPPFGAPPPAPPVDSLQPRDPLAMSPVVSDPGVFFAGERSDTVLRLPIPLHPITYVEGAIERAQQARAATDPLLFSNPAAVRAGEVQSTSIGAGLGFDPVVYVAPAVHGSQALGQWVGEVVDGRLERLSLSSDREIPTPDLAQPDPQQLVVMPQEADKPHTKPAEKPTHAKGHKKSADAGSDAVEHAPQALRAAPSFSDQLRVSLKRPVATLYARFNGH